MGIPIIFRHSGSPRFGDRWRPASDAALFGGDGTQPEEYNGADRWRGLTRKSNDSTDADWHQPLYPTSQELAETHLESAYNLARWLVRDPALADDVVQDAMVRALKYFPGFRGENARAWLLQIVRNVALTRLATHAGARAGMDAAMQVGERPGVKSRRRR